MQIGFTGTQQGMTEAQQVAVKSLLEVLCPNGGHVHHGDCVGADAQFHDLAHDRGLRIEIHPPTNPDKREFCVGDIVWPAYDYLVRNQHIIDCADILIAAPGEHHEQRRSGTWSTVRKARAKRITRYIVLPNGHIEEENA